MFFFFVVVDVNLTVNHTLNDRGGTGECEPGRIQGRVGGGMEGRRGKARR